MRCREHRFEIGVAADDRIERNDVDRWQLVVEHDDVAVPILHAAFQSPSLGFGLRGRQELARRVDVDGRGGARFE